MSKFYALLGVTLSTTLLAGQAANRATFEKITARFVKALKTKDVAWIDKTMAPDFVSFDARGKKQDRAATLNGLREMVNGTKFEKISASVLSVAPKGNQAVVKTSMTIDGTFLNPQTRKWSRIHDVTVDVETWVKNSAGWQIKIDKTLSEKSTIDGKPGPTG